MIGFPSPATLILHYMYRPHFVCLFIQWWTSDLLYLLALVTSDAMNTGVQIPLLGSAFNPSDKYPEVRLLDHIVLVLIFWGNSKLFSIVVVLCCISINSAQDSIFSTSSPTFIYCFLDKSNSSRYEAISYCSSDL